MYSSFHVDFPDVEFFASQSYIYVVQEGPEECIFDNTEAPACERDAMQPIHGTKAENQIVWRNEEDNLPVLPSGKIMNPTEENIDVLRCIGITIDDKNYPAPENVPEQQEKQQWNGEEGREVWKSEGIICPRKANNLRNYFACFCNLKKRRC